jgi:hypothetical protein
LEGVAGEAHDAPLGEDVRAEALVDGDGGRVPVEHVPLQAWAAFVDGDLRERASSALPMPFPRSAGVT